MVLVGRPNVGKSTLFNRLTRSRDALVADVPGLTRDRHYGAGRVGDKPFLVVDTGGLEPAATEGVLAQMARQTKAALAEADAVVFITDGREGVTGQDQRIAKELRRLNRPVLVAVNKSEGRDPALVTAEFHELGLGAPLAISAAHGEGVHDMVEIALARFPVQAEAPSTDRDVPKIAIVGRPNVGKSTLVNTLVGEERVIAFDQPGTTRDSIYVEFAYHGKRYTLIDTAGLRRRGKVFESIEKFSVVKTLQAIDDANVVILLLDARQDISEQDAHIAGFILERGRALVVAVNKWDGLEEDAREQVKRVIARKLKFLAFARFHYVSALAGEGIRPLFGSVDSAFRAAFAKLPTPRLTRELEAAIEQQAPPRRGLIRPKLRYAHQGGMNPPVIVIHGNALDAVPESYRRYLEARFRHAFELEGTPLRIEFRTGRNPYVNKRG
ncbi:MAG: ribosome biogenesis GTPase Der [Betaproteobacteria bacterium RBG_16_64_18]|nr:MAG: ribosome biogenesis GTPase Der [Betaproteobacteria bacterium RBG_16_64_18]OGA13474.1 MAG: ribosome biogenesis GTPase Der [Betaproteobacteria bacterium RIFCSPLOWO2_02_FULL_65_20]OGA36559.1 MAG: ribosome biogenesis GTPase Der [Betaproteobacteria bacterium RIFCSPLOWO2_12_FULL_65_110]